ncbi:MAG: alpha/beta hydrolase [Ilumatobacteraceae bacterium]
MSVLERGDARIHYEAEGDGFPVFTIAPGGLRSANSLWNKMPWNPRTALADMYQVIGMDQRNAGASSAPITAGDGWQTYLTDQLAVLDELGIEQCHLIGMCIGGPFVAGLLMAAPDRFVSAVMLQPVGIDGNRTTFYELSDWWRDEVRDAHPEAGDADFESFRSNMWDGEFLLTATREQIAACPRPLLVMMGNDQYHPQSTSREIAALAPNVEFVERWKEDEVLPQTDATIKSFLAAHTPPTV